MALPVIGIFAVFTAWLIKKVGFKSLLVTLQITMTSAAVVASLALFTTVTLIIIKLYNLFNTYMTSFHTVVSTDNIAFKVASASGIVPALTDIFSVLMPIIVSFLVFQLSIFFKNIMWKFTKTVFQIGMQMQV